MRMCAVVLLALVALAAAESRAVAQSSRRGLVLDAARAPVAGARVRIEPTGSPPVAIETGSDGRFETPAPVVPLTIRADAPGFAEASLALALPPAGDAVLVLQPASLAETVSTTRCVRGDTRAGPRIGVMLTGRATSPTGL